MRRLLVDNHETRKNQRAHIRRSIAVYRSLIDAEVLEVLNEPDEQGRPMRVNLDLQDDFRLNQPLSLFALEAMAALDRDAPDLAWQLLSVIESVLEDPMVILLAQLDRAKDALIAELKRDGVEYEQRMEQLEQLSWPKPEADFLEAAFDVFQRHHPWVGRDRVSPKSVVRDMLEHAETFNQYVARYGLKRSEGAVLRYLTDCYKAMLQTVPVDIESAEFDDLTEWLGEMIRRVDSSLLDEWERLRTPDDGDHPVDPPPPANLTANRRAFSVLVRNEMFRLLTEIAHGRPGDLADDIAAYWEEHNLIHLDADARSTEFIDIDLDAGLATQIICDPEGHNEWILEAEIDLESSDAEDRAVVIPVSIRRR